MEKEEEERRSRREAAMASAPCLQPNFKGRGVSKDQLSKFRELHKRRLQIKPKAKIKKKSKDEANKSEGNDLTNQDSRAEDLIVDNKEPSLWNSDSRNESSSSLEQDYRSVHFTPNKQKLHWGLDTKERWERKSNM